MIAILTIGGLVLAAFLGSLLFLILDTYLPQNLTTYTPKSRLTKPASSGAGAVSYGGYHAISGNPDTARPPKGSSPAVTGCNAPRSGSFVPRRSGESRPLQGGSFLPPVLEDAPWLVLPANEHCFVQELDPVGPTYSPQPPRRVISWELEFVKDDIRVELTSETPRWQEELIGIVTAGFRVNQDQADVLPKEAVHQINSVIVCIGRRRMTGDRSDKLIDSIKRVRIEMEPADSGITHIII